MMGGMSAGNQGQSSAWQQSGQNTGAGYYPTEIHTQSSGQPQNGQGNFGQQTNNSFQPNSMSQENQNGMNPFLPMLLSMLGGKGGNFTELLSSMYKHEQSGQESKNTTQNSESQTTNSPNEEILL